MASTNFTLPFRLVHDIHQPSDFNDDDSYLWLAKFEAPAPIDSFTITFERTENVVRAQNPQMLSDYHVTTQNPSNQTFFKDLIMLAFDYDDKSVHYDHLRVAGRANHVIMLSAANLASLAKRLHQFSVGKTFIEDAGATVDFDIRIKYSSTVGISFVNLMSIDSSDPAAFASFYNVRSLERLAGLEIDTTPNPPQPTSTDIVPVSYEQVTDIEGDPGRLSPVGEAPEVNLRGDFLARDGLVQSAILCDYHPPADKYRAMAKVLCEMCKPGSTVLIIEDQPQVLVQELLASRLNVTSVNRTCNILTTPAQKYRGRHKQIRARVVCDPDLRILDDRGHEIFLREVYAAHVVDMSSDNKMKLAATSLNIAIGQGLKQYDSGVPTIVHLRDRPKLEVCLAILDLPGQSHQGCDSYGILLQDNVTNFGVSTEDWQSFYWLRIETSGDQPDYELDERDHCHFQLSAYMLSDLGTQLLAPFFKRDQHEYPETAEMPRSNRRRLDIAQGDVYCSPLIFWYYIIVTRAFLFAPRNSLLGPERGLVETKNPVEALALLEHNLGDYQVWRNNITSCFDISDARQFTGTNPRLINRYPIRRLVSARYDALAAMCTFTQTEAPPEIKNLFKQPSSGVLLRGLSAIRNLKKGWRGPILADYKRVLPYGLMSVLAYKPFYVCIYHYLFACMHGLCKPLPTWELQYNLWALSMTGTNQERFAFMALKLRAAIFPLSSSGRLPGLLYGNDSPLASFEVNLRHLHVKAQYELADPEYVLARDEVFYLTCDPNAVEHEDMRDGLRALNLDRES